MNADEEVHYEERDENTILVITCFMTFIAGIFVLAV
jgi:hypothetical protein